MVAALQRHVDAMIAVGEQPLDDVLVEAALATATGDGAEFVQRYVDILRRDGYAVRENTTLPSRIEYFDDSATVIDATTGVVDVCDIDADVVVEVGADPGGADRIVDDGLQSSYVSYVLTKIDGAWLVSSRETVIDFPNQEGCE